MSKRKIINITLIIVILVLLIVGIIFIIKKNKYNDIYYEDIPLYEDRQKIESTSGKFQKLENITDYYTIKSCINKFLNSYSSLFLNNEDDERKNLYYMLDEKYIQYKEINLDDITSKIEEYEESIVTINNVISLTNYNGVYLYIANITTRTKISNINTDQYIMLILDRNNMTYSVLLNDYVISHKYNELNVGDTIDFSIPDYIENKSSNTFGYLPYSNDEYVEDLFEQFRMDLIYNEDRAYKLLDNEMKEKLYPTQESFNEFIRENYKEIYLLKYASYNMQILDDKIYYKCMDTNGRFFITFDVTAPMEYTYKFSF